MKTNSKENMGTTDSGKFQLHRRLEKTKLTLQAVLRRMLEINKAKKVASQTKTQTQSDEQVKEELKLLNRIADQQAQLVEIYESRLQSHFHRNS